MISIGEILILILLIIFVILPGIYEFWYRGSKDIDKYNKEFPADFPNARMTKKDD